MAEITLDCKGLPCPQPVLKCKECLEKGSPERLEVLVDNLAARENVTRFMQLQGFSPDAGEDPGAPFTLSFVRDAASCAACEVMEQEELKRYVPAEQQICVFIRSDVMGRGDDALGAKLMFNFINTLPELGPELWRIVLVNSGVKLAAQGSDVAEKLKEIEDSGVSVLVCGTCLDHFQLMDKKVLGETTNMLDVVTSLQLASKVLTP